MALKLALTYSGLLLACLLLVCALYFSAVSHAHTVFWDQQYAAFDTSTEVAIKEMDLVQNYTHMLVTDSTLVRLSNTTREDMTDLVMTADSVMKRLLIRSSSLLNLPTYFPHIYLTKSGYVISDSQFTEMESFYKMYQSYEEAAYDDWLAVLDSATEVPRYFDASPFTGIAGDVFVTQVVQSAIRLPARAIIWFVVNVQNLRSLLLPYDAEDCMILIRHNTEDSGILLTQDAVFCTDSDAYARNVQNRFSDISEAGRQERGGYVNFCKQTASGWQWIVSLPVAMAAKAGSSNTILFMGIMLLVCVFGVILIVLVVRLYMRPIETLSTQLTRAQDDNAELQQEIDAQRPLLCADYLRQITSGHVSSDEEFDYMMSFLGLTGPHRFYILYCAAHSQAGSSERTPAVDDRLIARQLKYYLEDRYPVYYYRTLSGNFVVLAAYDDDTADPLMDLQQRIVNMHNSLADAHGVWFYAGVGSCATHPMQLWESYEQARTAARYTAKHHIFLPYEMIRKDVDAWYYPIEISAKLQHFITSGNRQQVVEMFALIHRENIVERSLPIPLLNMLLSDLKNTLLKSRFQLKTPPDDAHAARVTLIDQHLSDTMSFAQLEDTALLLCDLFVLSKSAGNPVPEIEKYLQENFCDPAMCLSLVADHFKISPSYLSHLFKDKTGENFSVYLENLRLNEAAQRLQKDRECNLATLYAELGYTNATSFRRAFKKHFGITPSDMRDGK